MLLKECEVGEVKNVREAVEFLLHSFCFKSLERLKFTHITKFQNKTKQALTFNSDWNIRKSFAIRNLGAHFKANHFIQTLELTFSHLVLSPFPSPFVEKSLGDETSLPELDIWTFKRKKSCFTLFSSSYLFYFRYFWNQNLCSDYCCLHKVLALDFNFNPAKGSVKMGLAFEGNFRRENVKVSFLLRGFLHNLLAESKFSFLKSFVVWPFHG